MQVIAILVHYFSLAGFTWILLEAVMLYLKLILVYDGEFVRMKNFLLFGWGMIYICKINACKLFCGRKLNSEKCIKLSIQSFSMQLGINKTKRVRHDGCKLNFKQQQSFAKFIQHGGFDIFMYKTIEISSNLRKPF
jgi:hypothetical protein